MRRARLKEDSEWAAAFYHCVSRVVDKRFALGEEEKERFVKLMRGYEAFCGVRLVTFCIMSNHVHLLVEVPRRPAPADFPSDAELVKRLRQADCRHEAATLEQDLQRLRREGRNEAAEQLRERFVVRMWDVSWYMRLVKQRFTQWLNARKARAGTLWEGRFRSLLVDGEGDALAVVAAYIDLNPVRAGIVSDPKDYRWSGYGQAVAGVRRARDGVRRAIQGWEGGSVRAAMARYRALLYASGEQRQPGPDGEPGRTGFSAEEIEAVLARNGRLELSHALRCRVRYFCDGFALGGRAFLERVFLMRRDCFGERRRSGARPLVGVRMENLFVARALRVRRFG